MRLVMLQDTKVQHVGVGDKQLGLITNVLAVFLGGTAIVTAYEVRHATLLLCQLRNVGQCFGEFCVLVVRECFLWI